MSDARSELPDGPQRNRYCGALDPYIEEPCNREKGHSGLHRNEYEEWFYPHPTQEEARRKLAREMAERDVRRR